MKVKKENFTQRGLKMVPCCRLQKNSVTNKIKDDIQEATSLVNLRLRLRRNHGLEFDFNGDVLKCLNCSGEPNRTSSGKYYFHKKKKYNFKSVGYYYDLHGELKEGLNKWWEKKTFGWPLFLDLLPTYIILFAYRIIFSSERYLQSLLWSDNRLGICDKPW